MLGVVYVIYDDGRPLVEAYDGPQIVGMDLHRRRSVLVRMAENGHKLSTVRIANSPARLAAEIKRAGLHPKVVLEACYGWYWAADVLAAAGAEVHLAHPAGVKAFSHRRVKNDELDARDLADLLRMGRLAEAWIAPPEIRELREITRYRQKLVQLRTSCKDQVHGRITKQGSPALRWALIEAVQRTPAGTPIRQARDAIIARRGIQARNIAKVAAARKLLTYVFYAMRDGHVRSLDTPAAEQEAR